MAENSKIEWCDHTFNPWMGCTKVSPACQNCYAERDMDHRYGKVVWGPRGTRVKTSADNWRKPLKWNRYEAKYLHLVQDNLDGTADGGEAVARRPKVFCASLADVFEDWQGPILDHHGHKGFCRDFEGQRNYYWHSQPVDEEVTRNAGLRPITMDDLRADLFRLIDATPYLDWLLLTKRPENVRRMWPDYELCRWDSTGRELPLRHLRHNVWLGTSIENQEWADKRIPELLKCRDLSPVLFVSAEPILEPIDLDRSWKVFRADGHRLNRNQYAAECPTHGIDWVITGGESGPDARPCNPAWFRSLRDQCAAAKVPFFFKQWGEWDENQARVGKKAAGRLLDGRTYDDFPRY